MSARKPGDSSVQRPPVVFLMGATASGKTAIAIALAQRFEMDLVSVDSSQVYRGMDIGSAKPDAATLAACPHALIDIRDPHETYSAAEFARDAAIAIEASHARGRTPLLVGGTFLYFRALQRGLSPLPAANAALRQAYADDAAREGWPALHARLAMLDPIAARRIHPNDPQRIARALEVIALSGARLSDQHRAPHRHPHAWRTLKLVATAPTRAELHARIERRLDAMWDAGLLDEARTLARHPSFDADLPSMRAVGYRQALAHLRGEYSFDASRTRALHASRQLAKRQLTWLRSEHDAIALGEDALASATDRIAAFIPPRPEGS